MQEHYDRLGLSAEATTAEIKAAYHAQLKAFPAHSHPQEFKAIRTAYEAIQKSPQRAAQGATPAGMDPFFELTPVEAQLDEAQLKQLKAQAVAAVAVTLEDLMLATF
jgi:hypothetical protein